MGRLLTSWIYAKGRRYDPNVPTPPRIVRIEFSPPPRPKPAGFFDPMPRVSAEFSDGTRKELFSFYPDEIGFENEGAELIGLTEAEARALYRARDVAYLRTR